MRIDTSSISMQAASAKTELYAKTEYTEYWDAANPRSTSLIRTTTPGEDAGPQTPEKLPADAAAEEEKGVKLDLSEQGEKQLVNLSKSSRAQNSMLASPLGDSDTLRMNLIKMMFERLTGKKLKLGFLEEGFSIKASSTTLEDVFGSGAVAGQDAAPAADEGWGLIYTKDETYYESESMDFQAQGEIKTADGRSISIDLTLGMSREFLQTNHVGIRAGEAAHRFCDPLVINYGGKGADLTDTKVRFDLDCDGSEDSISMLKEGSGFLALDKNGDGAINDGSELFGTKSGDGFADLAAYDEDGNGWIDENDSVYDKLRIWETDSAGAQKLVAIGQRGVGAIYLGNVDTEYSVTSKADNSVNGQIRKTGLFLNENGTAGTVQHVDLAI